MRRRGMIGLLGGAALAGPSLVRAAAGASGWNLVNTPEKREAYAKRLLKELCTDLGPHPAGTPAHDRAAEIFEREMKRSLPKVEQVWFDMETWEMIGKPLFKVGDTELETWPSYGTPATPAQGLTGVLQKVGGGYSVVSRETGEKLAGAYVSPYGRAIPHGDHRHNGPVVPMFGLGKQDIPLLDRAAAEKTPVTVRVAVKFTPVVPASSVVGTLPGKTKDEILFIAHMDTVYNAPGANDNTASAIVMVMLAHAAAAMRPDLTVTVIAAGSEEYGYYGAWKCAKIREREGTMKNLKYVINFDSLTYGPNLQVHSTDADMRELIRSIHADLKINATPKYFEDTGFVMDSMPFAPSGAKAFFINSRGYDERTLPVYHRPEDTAESVPLDCVEISFRVFEEFIRRVGKR